MTKQFIMVIMWVFLASVSIWAESTQNLPGYYIVIDQNTKKEKVDITASQYYDDISHNKALKYYFKNKNPNIQIVKYNNEYQLRVGPFENEWEQKVALKVIKRIFPEAFGVIDKSSLNSSKQNNSDNNSKDTSSWYIWATLIILGGLLISGVAMLFASYRIKQMAKQHERMRNKQEELEKRQYMLFSTLGENLYNMSKDLVVSTQNLMTESKGDNNVAVTLENVVTKECKLLDITGNLLSFLRLKAHKVEIKEETFNINNLFDDVVGNLTQKFRGCTIELIFDISHELPKFVRGDLTQLGEILVDLLEHAMGQMKDGEVTLEVDAYLTYDGGVDLQARVIQQGKMYDETSDPEEYFTPNFDEKTGEYSRLGLFVAHELVNLMNGQITLYVPSKIERIIDVSIPLKAAQEEQRRKYPLPDRRLTRKEVYIVNKNYHASLALKNLFAYFKHHVKVDTLQQFREYPPDFSTFDIILIEEELVDAEFAHTIRGIKEEKTLMVVGLGSVFDTANIELWAGVFDAHIKKPLTQERVFMLIIELYHHRPMILQIEAKRRKGKEPFIRNVVETPNVDLHRFKDFSGTRLLVVEDNEVNTRMLLKVLEDSGIEIDTVDNGLKAVERIKELGEDNYDLVLMDINMPVMDGYTATMEIRKIPHIGSTIPIVALTALILESEIERMRACGMDAFLPKPLNLGKLYTVFATFVADGKVQLPVPVEESLTSEDMAILNVAMGLRYFDDNPLFYREILKEFLSLYGESGATMQKLLVQRKYKHIRQLNLDIMGLSGAIGAQKLHRSSAMIHKVFKYNMVSLLPHYVREYSKELAKLLEIINKYLNGGR